jgi:hypothetical protein
VPDPTQVHTTLAIAQIIPTDGAQPDGKYVVDHFHIGHKFNLKCAPATRAWPRQFANSPTRKAQEPSAGIRPFTNQHLNDSARPSPGGKVRGGDCGRVQNALQGHAVTVQTVCLNHGRRGHAWCCAKDNSIDTQIAIVAGEAQHDTISAGQSPANGKSSYRLLQSAP